MYCLRCVELRVAKHHFRIWQRSHTHWNEENTLPCCEEEINLDNISKKHWRYESGHDPSHTLWNDWGEHDTLLWKGNESRQYLIITCSGWKGNTYIRTRSPGTFVKEKDKELNLDRIFFLKKDLYHKRILIEDHEGFRVYEYIISCLMKCCDRISQMYLTEDHNCFGVLTGFFESKSTHSLHQGHNPGQVMTS
jgi:hypothetical protein